MFGIIICFIHICNNRLKKRHQWHRGTEAPRRATAVSEQEWTNEWMKEKFPIYILSLSSFTINLQSTDAYIYALFEHQAEPRRLPSTISACKKAPSPYRLSLCNYN